MARPNFFCDIDALNCLLGMVFEGEYRDIPLTFDLVELPYYFMFSGDEKSWTMRAISRGEIYNHDGSGIEAGKLVADKFSDEARVEANNRALGENMGAFFAACRNISCYIQQEKLETVYEDFDPEETGILLCAQDGELTWKVVEGMERPELMCTTLFGGTVMCRPYMEDFWDRSLKEMMPLEEKIEQAEAGDTDLMDELAQMYLNGDGEVEEDPVQAVYWLRKLAEAGNSNGMFNLGLHYAKGHGLERDFAMAAHWMEQAAAHGDEDAPVLVEKYRKAAAAMEKLPEGDAQAQADLAGVLMGLAGSLEQAGAGRDYEEAFELAKASAAQGNGDGLWTLALAYEHGRGVAQDKEKCVECYRKGAELGHAPSQHSLGCYYMRGEIVGTDKAKAVELVSKAAEQGYALAYFFLAKAYELGDGVEQDLDIALQWGEKAAENGTPDVQYEVAKMYTYDGEKGGMIDADRARYWLAKAANRGHEKAYGMLNFAPMWETEPEEEENEYPLPDGMAEILEVLLYAEEMGYQPKDGTGTEGHIAFLEKLAQEGDEEAREILEHYRAANG